MKLSFAALVVGGLALTAQDRPAELKNLAVVTAASLQPIRLSAREIVRELPYPAVIHLKGNVEIRTPVCVVSGPGGAHTCGGYIVLRAEQADFHEGSGQIDASGSVRVTNEP